MENQNDKITEKESRIIDNSEVKDRVLRDESDKDGEQIINDRPIDAENAVPPDAWKINKNPIKMPGRIIKIRLWKTTCNLFYK